MISGKNESAVSPVVGVMLMLVVTIIIAAVVSAFAGGMADSKQKTPTATLSTEVNIGNGITGAQKSPAGYTYPEGYTCENNYIVFSHNGGDGFDLSEIEIQFQGGDNKMSFAPSDKPITDTTTAYSCRIDPSNKTYLKEIGDNADGFIKPGDKFKMTFDGNYISKWDGLRRTFFYKEGAKSGFGFQMNKRLQYMIIDRVSGKTIQTGDIIALE